MHRVLLGSRFGKLRLRERCGHSHRLKLQNLQRKHMRRMLKKRHIQSKPYLHRSRPQLLHLRPEQWFLHLMLPWIRSCQQHLPFEQTDQRFRPILQDLPH